MAVGKINLKPPPIGVLLYPLYGPSHTTSSPILLKGQNGLHLYLP